MVVSKYTMPAQPNLNMRRLILNRKVSAIFFHSSISFSVVRVPMFTHTDTVLATYLKLLLFLVQLLFSKHNFEF